MVTFIGDQEIGKIQKYKSLTIFIKIRFSPYMLCISCYANWFFIFFKINVHKTIICVTHVNFKRNNRDHDF